MTVNVGYNFGEGSLVHAPGWDDGRLAESLRARGARNIVVNTHIVDGMPVLLIEADTGPADAGDKLHMACIAVPIDMHVDLVSDAPAS